MQAVAAVLGAVVSLAAPGTAAACRAIPVTTTIQAAVGQAQPCDWVVIPPGTYRESVLVTTPNVHLRGLDRNRVVLDGQHRTGVNGIEIRADGVSVENLTVRNFDGGVDGTGNQIWWNGGDGSGRIGIHGWKGRYLTTYDTGLGGEYGLFTSNAVDGSWDHVYASGFADSGIYLGACRDCRAVISHALVERNALGYSGTNSGGHVIVQDSVFRNNSVGVAPSSLASDDPPPPQLGACDSGANTSPTPLVATTRISRCTIFRRNRIEQNNNLTTPANETTSLLPWGTGIELAGTYGDLIANNIVSGNRNFGILAHEYPDPFPPTQGTVYFQSAGNRISANIVRGSRWDIALEGGLFGAKQSVNDCVAANRYRESLPADLRPWSCANGTTPNVDAATASAVLQLVLKLQSASLARHAAGQPAPPPQPTMPDPCRGIPPNTLCK